MNIPFCQLENIFGPLLTETAKNRVQRYGLPATKPFSFIEHCIYSRYISDSLLSIVIPAYNIVALANLIKTPIGSPSEPNFMQACLTQGLFKICVRLKLTIRISLYTLAYGPHSALTASLSSIILSRKYGSLSLSVLDRPI